MDTKDCHGNILNDGDTVIVTKDLKVKGSSPLKRGKTFKKIRLTSDTGAVECREGKATLVIKTCYLKKS